MWACQIYCMDVCLFACLSECLSVCIVATLHITQESIVYRWYLDGFRIKTWEPHRHIGIVSMPQTESIVLWCNCFESSWGIVSTSSLLSQIPSLSALLSSKNRLHGSEKDGSRQVSCAPREEYPGQNFSTACFNGRLARIQMQRQASFPTQITQLQSMKSLRNWVVATVGFYCLSFSAFSGPAQPSRGKKAKASQSIGRFVDIDPRWKPLNMLFSMSLGVTCKFALQAAGSWYSTIAAVIILAVLGGIGYMVVTGHLRHSWPTSEHLYTHTYIYT
jgi:hypothetical protein